MGKRKHRAYQRKTLNQREPLVQNKSRSKIIILALPVSFALFFSIYAHFDNVSVFERKKNKALATLSWQETEGVLVHLGGRPRKDDSRAYFPLKYSYKVNGEMYSSSQHSILNEGFLVYDLLKAKKYSKKITVYYDPYNPNNAVLYKGYDHKRQSSNQMVFYVLIIICGILDFLIFYVYFFKLNGHEEERQSPAKNSRYG